VAGALVNLSGNDGALSPGPGRERTSAAQRPHRRPADGPGRHALRLEIEPLASLDDDDDAVAAIALTIQRYLDGDAYAACPADVASRNTSRDAL
jgi:hypothetical protein